MAPGTATATRKPKSGGQARVQELVDYALEKGAFRAKAFAAQKVVIDERVRLKCQIPLCPHFGRSLTCPPNVPSVDEFRKALRLYRTALMIQTRAPLSLEMDAFNKTEVLNFLQFPGSLETGGTTSESKTNLEGVKLQAVRLHKLVNEVEAEAMAKGFHYALGLIGGECMLCPKCAGPGAEGGCRRPYQARPSMEGVGIDVVKTAIHAGLSFDIPPKQEVIWSGLILIG